MNIFLSWSGDISREIALIFKQMLEDCFSEKVSVFMSAKDIVLGTNGINTIFNSLSQSDVCISFITPMNMSAPWIAFEAGMVAGSSNENNQGNMCKRIIPLIFGNIDMQKFSKNPLHNYQYAIASFDIISKICVEIAQNLSYKDIIKIVDQIRPKIQNYFSRMNEISEQIPGSGLLKSKGFIEYLNNENLFGASLHGEVVEFDGNFETPELYRAVLKYVDKQLYIFGRKNTKLFTNTNRPFFEDLQRKTQNGFDFKCLFVSPESKYINKAKNDPNFLEHLNDRMLSAENLINNEELFKKVCREYKVPRNTAIIIADDVVIFSPLSYDINGAPNPLTYADFFIADKNSEIGKKYVNVFNDAWKNSTEITHITTSHTN